MESWENQGDFKEGIACELEKLFHLLSSEKRICGMLSILLFLLFLGEKSISYEIETTTPSFDLNSYCITKCWIDSRLFLSGCL